MHIRNGLELGDIVEITNYLGVYEHEMPTKNQYKKHCTCKEAEKNRFRIIEFVDDDELVEVTPHHIRLRKVILDTVDRKKFDAARYKNK